MFLTYVIACASPVATYTKKDIAFYQLHQENVKHDVVVNNMILTYVILCASPVATDTKKTLPFINFIKKMLNTT